MRYLDAQFNLPDWMLHPMSRFLRHRDIVQYEELLTWSIRPEEGVEYELFYIEAPPDRYRQAVGEVDSIVDYTVAPIDDSSLHVWACEETRPEIRAWRSAFYDQSLVVVPPIRFDSEANMGMTIVGAGEDIQQLMDVVPDEIDVTVNEIGTYDRRGGTLANSLTDRQLEALDVAMSMGYYEVPRGAELADVAAQLECAESSASVLLRRAEREVFSRVLERYGGTVGRSPRKHRSRAN